MWDLYRRKFIVNQIVFVVAVVGVYLLTRNPLQALAVFLICQVAAVAGAAWGTRLKAKVDRDNEQLPLKPR